MSQHEQPSAPPPPSGPQRRGGGVPDTLLLGGLGLLVSLAALTWSATGIGGWLRHGSWPDGVSFLRTGQALKSFLTAPSDIPDAWTAADPTTLPSASLLWLLFFAQVVVLFSLVLWLSVSWTRWRARRDARGIVQAIPPEPEPADRPTAPVEQRPAAQEFSRPQIPTPASAPPPRADPVGAVLDAPEGLVVADPEGTLWAKTAKQRGRRGPVHVYDPGHLTEAPVRLRWAPQRDCAEMSHARERATRLLDPVRPREPVFQLDAETAETLLRCYLHAAALAGEPFQQIPRWANGRSPGEPGKILRTHPGAAGGAAMELESTLTVHPGRRDAALRLIGEALRPLDQVHIRQSCSPGRVDGLALDNLTNEGATLYVVGAGADTAGLRAALVHAVTKAQPALTLIGHDGTVSGPR
ncbi:hypothetical protein [Streptomyces profundus]|uniref:hypothetical protein n=1 Tax=Streptomyces profundus TaxID=2867410 RepID=UPI001D16BDE0|nr:hypothetical protein [Streptomyces sp. MA3_2.13]UED85656.1 hypothetical protein K4G22_16855 [Streptomyces sp. MA3_2.13]